MMPRDTDTVMLHYVGLCHMDARARGRACNGCWQKICPFAVLAWAAVTQDGTCYRGHGLKCRQKETAEKMSVCTAALGRGIRCRFLRSPRKPWMNYKLCNLARNFFFF
ncbi:unnamed protein product, partial [Ixodes pacificus]